MSCLEKAIDKLFAENIVKNVAVEYGIKGKICGSAYRSAEKTIDENTLFDMASVTKIVCTTSLALIGLEKGLISLDDKVSKYFPCPEDKKEMSIFHLLTHTMGIGHKDFRLCKDGYNGIAEYILSLPSEVKIGTEVIYSCPGFILLAKILEKVFGERLDVLFEKYVANPLSMKNSGFKPIERKNIVNSNQNDEEIGLVNDYNCRYLGEVCGNAGLFSCISDLRNYKDMLLAYGSPIISKEWFEKAKKNYTENMSANRGLGFLYVEQSYPQTAKIFPDGSIGHCGHTGQSIFVDVNSGLYAIILSDATRTVHKKLGHESYDEVRAFRQQIHKAIKEDLTAIKS